MNMYGKTPLDSIRVAVIYGLGMYFRIQKKKCSRTVRKVRRASTPLTACLSQNGGHHLVWPQRRVPPSKVLEHLLEEAGWRLVLPPAHERLTNNATKPGALHAHLDILLTLADLVRSARPNASRFPITLTAPRLSSATSAQRTPEIDKTA